MKFFLLILSILIIFQSANAATVQPKIQFLSQLDRFEPFEAHLFHAGVLWTGRSRKDLGAFYRLEVFDGSGHLLSSKELNHSLTHIYPFGPDSILVVGTSATPNLTQYTIATRRGSEIILQNTQIPAEAWANTWAGIPGKMYFTDPGGMYEGEEEVGAQPKASRTIFTMTDSGPSYLHTRIHGPEQMLFIDNKLYVVFYPNVKRSESGLIRVDLDSDPENPTILWSEEHYDLDNMVQIEGTKTLAILEGGANQIILFDTLKDKVLNTVSIPGPRGIAQLGKCLVVGSEVQRHVFFVDIKSPKPKTVAEWDLSSLDVKRFKAIRNLAIDPETGNVFARSAYACIPFSRIPCEPLRNSVVMAREESGATLTACK